MRTCRRCGRTIEAGAARCECGEMVPGARPRGRWLLQLAEADLRVIEDMGEIDHLIVERQVTREALIYDLSQAPRRIGEMLEFKRFFDLADRSERKATPPVLRAPRVSGPIEGVDPPTS